MDLPDSSTQPQTVVRSGEAASRRESPWPCWLEVDLDAIADNTRQVVRQLGPATAVMAVVKAQGYGLGAAAVARACLSAGVSKVAVARVQEAVQLRQEDIQSDILLLSSFMPEEAPLIVRYGLTPTVVDPAHAHLLARAAEASGERVRVHVKVDTGLNRFGASPGVALATARAVSRLPSLHLEGVYTHFAVADERDASFCAQQLAEFIGFCSRLEEEGIKADLYHAANSAAMLRFPEARLDMVRPGLVLLGFLPSPWVPVNFPLVPAATLKARVTRVFPLSPGQTIGYGRTHKVERPMLAALVSAGYADGLPRSHSNKGQVLVRGQRSPLVGRVSMDQCVVDVTHIPDVAVGDEVVLFGEQGEESIGLEEYASWSDTIGHEALCRIGPRVPRVYRRGQRVVWAATLSGQRALDLPQEGGPDG